MGLNNKNFLAVLAIIIISASFFLGYFLRENSVGGGVEFYVMEWPITQSIKKDFWFTIRNYASFGDGTLPFSYIINAYLNPFSNNEVNLQLSITIISFVIFFLFAFVLKKNFLEINFINIMLTSSVILLLPFFRTSAFWGKNENYGWLFFIVALYFFSEIKKNISKTPHNKDLLNVILFCLSSSCALYARQALVFLPVSYLLYLFFNRADKKIVFTSIISFVLLSIPYLLLILFWREKYGTQDNQILLPISFNEKFLHPNFILINTPILLSYFGFYLLPILIIEFFNTKFKDFFNSYFKSFILILIIFFILLQTNILNYLGTYELGGGAILKLNYLLEKNNFLLLLFFSSIGFSILIRFFKEDMGNNVISILPMFIIYCFPIVLYQEYVEPLILIMFFLTIKTSLHKIYFKNIFLSNAIFLSYFTIYLVGSIYFKHFAFTTLESWKIFINTQ